MKAYKTDKEDSKEASGGSRRFGRFFVDENISFVNGAQRRAGGARGLPAAAAALLKASLDDAAGRTGRSRRADGVPAPAAAKRCFGAERSGKDESY